MSRVVAGINDLETLYPSVAKEWNYGKNRDLTPKDITAGSGRRVWWKCRLGHEWKTAVYHRKEGHGCPYCASREAITKPGMNDLMTVNPLLSAQWDDEKNEPLKPSEVTAYSQMKVWWKCELGHSWKTTVSKRTKGQGCPYCVGSRILPGVNDLKTTHPELSEEWNFTRNGKLLPQDIMAGSSKIVWWKCREGHEWRAAIYSRKSGNGCPVCAGNTLVSGVNDLLTLKPELSNSWDYQKNGPLTPDQVAANSSKSVWWICSEGHSWKARIYSRYHNRGCPYCAGRMLMTGYNDLLSQDPALCEEWDYEKNKISPENITVHSRNRVWWIDSLGHSWRASPSLRRRGRGCPYCNHVKVLKGFNDFASNYPTLICQWHMEKNGDLMPDQVMAKSHKSVWWICQEGHEWKARIADREKNGCPYCANKKVLKGYNDLASRYPEIAAEWDFEKNGTTKPDQVLFSSGKRYWWKCEKGHSWNGNCYKRHIGQNCPYCSGARAYAGYNDLKTKAAWLLEEWDWERNVDIDPGEILPYTNRKAWWKCNNGHHWRSSINSRHKGIGCPYCSGRITTRTHLVP